MVLQNSPKDREKIFSNDFSLERKNQLKEELVLKDQKNLLDLYIVANLFLLVNLLSPITKWIICRNNGIFAAEKLIKRVNTL